MTAKRKRRRQLGRKVRDRLMGLSGAEQQRIRRVACLDLEFRAQHDPLGEGDKAVECIPEAERDRRGASHRTRDTLDMLKARGTITDSQFNAGRRFERDFDMARLERLHAVPLVRVAPGAGDFEQCVYDARDRVRLALAALGPPDSPIRSLAWQILAEGRSLKQCQHQSSNGSGVASQSAVSTGIFIAALALLQMHYTGARKKTA